MQLPVMTATERHSEFVADFSAQRTTLRKAQMVGVARLTAADHAALLGNKAHMLAIANTPRLGMRGPICRLIAAPAAWSTFFYSYLHPWCWSFVGRC